MNVIEFLFYTKSVCRKSLKYIKNSFKNVVRNSEYFKIVNIEIYSESVIFQRSVVHISPIMNRNMH